MSFDNLMMSVSTLLNPVFLLASLLILFSKLSNSLVACFNGFTRFFQPLTIEPRYLVSSLNSSVSFDFLIDLASFSKYEPIFVCFISLPSLFKSLVNSPKPCLLVKDLMELAIVLVDLPNVLNIFSTLFNGLADFAKFLANVFK